MDRWLKNIFYIAGTLFFLLAIVFISRKIFVTAQGMHGGYFKPEAAAHCPPGSVWSPTLQICVENNPQPEALPLEQEGSAPTQGQPCNPNVPRYQQPGCVEQ